MRQLQAVGEVSIVEMANFQKRSIFLARFVQAKRPHDAECGGALQGSPKASGSVEKIRLSRPAGHLLGVQEEAAGMGIVHALKDELLSECLKFQPRPILAVLVARADGRVDQIAIDVELLDRRQRCRFESIGLKYRIVSGLSAKPIELDEQERVGNKQVVFKIAVIIVFPEI